jgi:SAM-dependent methyltransferase
MTEWFQSWFDSPYYHKLYAHRDQLEAEVFIKRLFPTIHLATNRKILDLACGNGRHSLVMNKMGHFVTGIDLSEQNIGLANRFASSDLEFFVHDMRQSFRYEFYDLVVNLFTSFGYFESTDENLKVLNNIAENLKPGGELIIDYLNPSYVKRKLKKEEIQTVNDLEFKIFRKIYADVVEKRIEIIDAGESYEFYERVRLFDHSDFLKFFEECNFELIDVWGNYDLTRFSRNSPRQIMHAKLC